MMSPRQTRSMTRSQLKTDSDLSASCSSAPTEASLPSRKKKQPKKRKAKDLRESDEILAEIEAKADGLKSPAPLSGLSIDDNVTTFRRGKRPPSVQSLPLMTDARRTDVNQKRLGKRKGSQQDRVLNKNIRRFLEGKMKNVVQSEESDAGSGVSD